MAQSVDSNLERAQIVDADPTKISYENCNNCGSNAKCRRRSFSEQAWSVLLLWNEVNPNAIEKPICDDCYKELRDVLIDRTDEIESAMSQGEELAMLKKKLANLAS